MSDKNYVEVGDVRIIHDKKDITMSIKNKKIYLPVGKIGVIDGLVVQAIETFNENDPKCEGCALVSVDNCFCAFGSCEAESRPDGKNVIFVKVESDEDN